MTMSSKWKKIASVAIVFETTLAIGCNRQISSASNSGPSASVDIELGMQADAWERLQRNQIQMKPFFDEPGDTELGMQADAWEREQQNNSQSFEVER
ncbi:MAG: hypothetical protein AAF664_03095 [Planctomycetota bacterium]